VSLPAGSHLGSGATEELVSLLCFRPQTGRRHQLRIHAARHGHPLLGDRRYGGPRQLIREDGRIVPLSRILLQAVSTELPLPSGKRWSIHCPVDEEVGGFWRLLGGNDADFRQ
jgi:23S rRNA pseudouridine1911/1915/1917 synthase